MSELIILRGLPASGKSTWARVHQLEAPGALIVNRDALRRMLHGDRPHSHADEAVTRLVRDAIISVALREGRSVISDDTNLTPKHVADLTTLARCYGATVRIVALDTPLDVCIRRDAARATPLGEAAIRALAERARKAVGEAL